MVIQGKISCKDAIIVDERLLHELEEIILEFYPEVAYSCNLCNGNKMEFKSLEELLSYENTKIRKIVSLSISYGYFNEIIFKPIFEMFSSYEYTVQGTFKTQDHDASILFSEKINDALNKNKQSKWYTIITKISIFHFFILLFIFSLICNIFLLFTKGFNASQEIGFTPTIVSLSIAFMFICVFFGIILSKCRDALLPPIAFKIGEQIKEIEKGRELFSKIFWGVFIAFLISVLAGKIF